MQYIQIWGKKTFLKKEYWIWNKCESYLVAVGYLKSVKHNSQAWTGAYQRNRKDFGFLSVRQLSISNTGCHRRARKSIRMDVFRLLLSLFCLMFTGNWRPYGYPASSARMGEIFPRKCFVKTNIVSMWNLEPLEPPRRGRVSDPLDGSQLFPQPTPRRPGCNLLPSEEGNQTQGIGFCKRRAAVFETEYVSMKTNTACLPLKEIFTGSKQVSAKWKGIKTQTGCIPGRCILLTVPSHKWNSNCGRHVSSQRAQKYERSCSMWSGRKGGGVLGGFFGRVLGAVSPFSPLLSAASVRSAIVLSNKAALSTSRASSPKAPSPHNTATLKAEEREFSCCAAFLFVPSSLSDPCFVLN